MRVLVTGAGGAIGAAAVRAFVNDGHEVIGLDISEKALYKTEGMSDFICGDICDLDDYAVIAERLKGEWLDSVVVAHGIDGSSPLKEIDEAFCKKVMRINALSVVRIFELTKLMLTKSNGTFVVVVSQAGIRAEPNNVAYDAAKFGLNGWITALAEHAEEIGVKVRSDCPGCIGTPLYYSAQTRYAQAQGVSLEDYLAFRNSRIPLGRIADVEEIAASLVFMADKNKRPLILAPTGGETLL